jgi:DNA processing protein
MAVPGSPLDPRAQGCNQLIREGATLIQNAEDVLEALNPIGFAVREPPSPYASDRGDGEVDPTVRKAVIGLLNATPVPADELIRQTGFPPAIVHTVLLELELAGRLDRHAGGRVSLTGN